MYPEKILLIVLNTPFTVHTSKIFGFKTKYKGWRIIYWNILPLVNKKLDRIYTNTIKNKDHIKINSLSNLISEYKKTPPNFFYFNGVDNSILISLLDRILKFSGGTKISLPAEGFPDVKLKYKEIIMHDSYNKRIYNYDNCNNFYAR